MYSKRITVANSKKDYVSEMKRKREQLKDKDMNTASIEDKEAFIDLIFKDSVVIERPDIVINNNNKLYNSPKEIAPNYSKVNDYLNKLNKNGFFQAISSGTTSSEMLAKTLKFNDLNQQVHHSNQKGGSYNESLSTLKRSYSNLQNIKEKGGELYVLDLETFGGTNAEGIWKPKAITEFSLQSWKFSKDDEQFGMPGKKGKDVNIVVGLDIVDTEEMQLLDEIKKAIKDKTIESNEYLRVSASRFSLYGHKDTKMHYDEKTGTYILDSFADTELSQHNNISAIEKGWNRLKEIGERMEKEKVNHNGLRADYKLIGESLSEMNDDIKKGRAMLGGQNHTLFDINILNSLLNKWYYRYYPNLDVDTSPLAGSRVNLKTEETIDFLGAVQLYYENFGTSDLFPQGMGNAKSVARQEDILKLHLGQWMTDSGLVAHKASDDVFGLIGIMLKDSEVLREPLLDHIVNRLNTVDAKETKLEANKHILRAKRRPSTSDGKNFLNFAIDKEGNVFTSQNFTIENGKVNKQGYSAGFGINKNAIYDITKIQKIPVNERWVKELEEIAPEYSSKHLYHLQLKMATSKSGESSRLEYLTQNYFFKSIKEFEAFVSNVFDVIGEKDENGNVATIYKDQLDKLDIRQLNIEKDHVNFSDVNQNYGKNVQQLYDDAVDFSNKKILTSRAENAFFKYESYDKIKKAVDLESDILNIFKEEGINKTSLSNREINLIMSSNVAKGKEALGINDVLYEKIRKTTEFALLNKRNEITQSSIDNYSSMMEFVENNKLVLRTLTEQVEEIASGKSDLYKKELFFRAYNQYKKEVADYIYRNTENADAVKAKNVLNDVKLQAPLYELKNIFELNVSSIKKESNLNYISKAKPESVEDLLKLDLSNKGSRFSLVSNAVNVVYGKNLKTITQSHKEAAMRKIFKVVDEDSSFEKSNILKDFKNLHGWNGKDFKNKDVNFLNIADTIISAAREVKEKDGTIGIKNVRYAFMKSLEGDQGYVRALNSKDSLAKIPDIVKDIAKDLKVINIPKEDKTKLPSAIDELLMKYYVPDLNTLKKHSTWNEAKTDLYNKGYSEIKKYLNEIIQGFSSIENTQVKIQDNGSILVTNPSIEDFVLDKLPKIKFDEKSGIMYLKVGQKELEFNKKIFFKSGNTGITTHVGTNLNNINKYSYIASLNKKILTPKENVLELKRMVDSTMNKVMDLPTINFFSGNNYDANFNVDVSEIGNILYDLFGENGRHTKLLANEKFMDRKLQETLRQKLKHASFEKNKELKNISPDMWRSMVKDMPHILQGLAQYSDDKEFIALANRIKFVGSENKVTSFVGYDGDIRPGNSAFSAADNHSRPPVTQSGNAKFLEFNKDNESKLASKNVTMKNLISSKYIDDKTIRKNTTSDVMLDIKYISSNALDILIDNNLDVVMEKSRIEYKTQEAVDKAFEYIRGCVSTFEQERLMDSRIHEDIYGLQPASYKKLSISKDLKGALKDLSQEDFDEQFNVLYKQLGSFDITKSGDLIYTPSIGKVVKKGEKILETKGFAGLATPFVSNINTGLFNLNFYNNNGLKETNKNINNLIKENIDKFKKDGKFIDKNLMHEVLFDILEQNDIKAQFSVEDIGALGYAKTLTSGAEKGMTDILYATTGSFNKQVKTVFKNLGQWKDVEAKVLTNEAIDAFVQEGIEKMKLEPNEMFKGTTFKNIKEFKDAIITERHMVSNMFFDFLLDGKTHLVANDNIFGHGNYGAMYQGSLSKAINLISKENGGDLNKSVNYLVNLINTKEEFQFLENWNFAGKTMYKTPIRLSNNNSRIYLDEDLQTSLDKISNFNNKKFQDLLLYLDKEVLGSKNNDDSLVRRNVWVSKTGSYDEKDLEKVDLLIGSYHSQEINGKTVILGGQSYENVKYVTDLDIQTGVTEEFFEYKRAKAKALQDKRKLEYNIRNAKDKQSADNYRADLNEVKLRLERLEETLIAQQEGMKITRVGEQELSIMDSMTITKRDLDLLNERRERGELDLSIFDTWAFKDKLTLTKDSIIGSKLIGLGNMIDEKGKPYAGEGIRVLSRWTEKIRQDQWFNKDTDVPLTYDMITSKEYEHLEDIWKDFNSENKFIDIDKAEQLYQVRSSFEAIEFNKGQKSEQNIQHLLSKGFEKVNIQDLTFDVDEIANKNLLIDLGEDFVENGPLQNRYLALPGTGKIVVDEEIRKKSHSELRSLQGNFLQYMRNKGGDEVETIENREKVITNLTNISKNINEELQNKHGLLHEMSRVDIGFASYRNKISGVVGEYLLNDKQLSINGSNMELIDSYSYSATKNSMIQGDSISNWEKKGVNFDYTFVSKEQMKNMGFYSEKTLSQYGFLQGRTMEEASELMDEFLTTHGTVTLFDRFPNTRMGSIVLTKTFLNKDLAQNQSKISVSIVGKANGDFDGDSGSSYVLRFIDNKNRMIDAAYYNLVKQEALKELEQSGLAQTRENLLGFVKASNKMEVEDFEYFDNVETYLSTKAVSENKQWADKAYKTILKDGLKNNNMADMSKAAFLHNGYSNFLKENVTVKLSDIGPLKEFNVIEDASNEMIKEAQILFEKNNLIGTFTKGLSDEEAKAVKKDWDEFLKINSIRETNSTKALDKVLAVYEKNDSYKFPMEYAKSIAIKKINQDTLVKENVAKTGLSAVGNINLALNSIKLATKTAEKTPADTTFTGFIWDILGDIEQKVISDKKREEAGYDEEIIEQFSDAMKKIYTPVKQEDKAQGISELRNWVKANAQDTFENSFQGFGKAILPYDEFKAIKNTEQGVEKMQEVFIDYIYNSSNNQEFTSIVATYDAIGRNSGHFKNLSNARAFASKGETLNASTLKYAGQSNSEQMRAIEIDLEQKMNRKITQETSRKAYEDSITENKKILKEGITDTVIESMQHISNLPLNKVSGIGKAMLGFGAGLLASGYASGNPLRDKQAQQVSQESNSNAMTVPQFLEEGGMITGNSQQGYVINLQADTKKGRKYMKKMMKQAAEASVGGAVSVNMNLRDFSNGQVTDRDIENYLDRYI